MPACSGIAPSFPESRIAMMPSGCLFQTQSVILLEVGEDAFASLRPGRLSMRLGIFNVLAHEALDASGALLGLQERTPKCGCANFGNVLMLRNRMDFFFVESAEIKNLL
jgi:hypothetical protein